MADAAFSHCTISQPLGPQKIMGRKPYMLFIQACLARKKSVDLHFPAWVLKAKSVRTTQTL